MKPRVTVITIGVDDLERAFRFYQDGLGLKSEGIVGQEFDYGSVAFFELQADLKLALWPRASIAHDSGLALSSPSPTEFTLGHNVSSRAEVDAVMRQASDAGATLVKAAQETLGSVRIQFQHRFTRTSLVSWPALSRPHEGELNDLPALQRHDNNRVAKADAAWLSHLSLFHVSAPVQ